MKHVQFKPEEYRNPRVEILQFERLDTVTDRGFEVFAVVHAALNGRRLTPLGVMRERDGELGLAFLEDMGETGTDPTLLHPFVTCVTNRMRMRIAHVVMRHAREVDRAERGEA